MGARLQSDEDLSDTSLGLQFVIFGISREFQFGRSLAPGAAAQRPWRRRFFHSKAPGKSREHKVKKYAT